MRRMVTINQAARAAFCAWLWLAPISAFSQGSPPLALNQASAAFQAANDACLKDDFSACIGGYEQLLTAGYTGADLEYNLGTAYLRQGKPGFATLHFERALLVDSNDADARANLQYVRRMRVDKLVGGPQEAHAEESLISRVVMHTSANRWTAVFLICWSLGGLALVVGSRCQFAAWQARLSPSSLKSGLIAVGILGLMAALPSGAVTAAHIFVRERGHEAIVVSPSLPVRQGPQEHFKASFEVHEGLKVRVLDQEGGYKLIRLANGLEGWVRADGAIELTPS